MSRMITVRELVEACAGTLVGDWTDALMNQTPSGVELDSRKVQAGGIFLATKGEKVDGHSFVNACAEKGALAAVVEYVPEGCTLPCVVVKDSFAALKAMASAYRAILTIPIVGITGSVGKTSTKEMIASVLGSRYTVLKTPGNYNNEVGLPLTVLSIRPEHEAAVLEMGISEFGEMTRLSAIARPDIAVITNVGQCHLENLKTRDGILQAKTEIFTSMNQNGTVVLNGEDDKLSTVDSVHHCRILRFGHAASGYEGRNTNDTYVTNKKQLGLLGTDCTIVTPEGEFAVHIPLPGEHMVLNALAATLVGLSLGLTTEEIRKGIENVPMTPGRGRIVKTENYVVIDDCYNANPVSMKAGISLLASAKDSGAGRTIAILGDMFELGEEERALHATVGDHIRNTVGIDGVVTVGTLTREIHENLVQGGYSGIALHYDTLEECNPDTFLETGDTILVKASHGMHFERLLTLLGC